ncbi:MAG TPA: redoxin domain-containing protein [Pyrinomonadaceae bacterium]
MRKNLIFGAILVCLLSVAAFAQGNNMMTAERSKTHALTVGETAPDFSLIDDKGKTVALSSIKGTTVIVFYRAYWCPFCVRQLADLRNLKQDGFTILAISPDPIERLKETKSKVAKDGKGEIPFALLSDPGSKTVNAFGVYDPTYAGQDVDGIPRAAIFILDKDRRIVWANVSMDYKKRPTLDEIRAKLEKIKMN